VNRTLLKTQLVRHEGLRLKPYRCTAGKLTIGVGRNLDDRGLSDEEVIAIFGEPLEKREWLERIKRGITSPQAMLLLDNDIEAVVRELWDRLPWVANLSDARQRALVNMGFNLGVRGLLAFKRTLASIRRGDYAVAAAQMLESKWARQVGRRATELAQQMKEGV
jgi:lysozyme